MSNTITCKESSASSGEHLYGTAPRVDHWFLLEYSDHWERNALSQSSIPQNVKKLLAGLLTYFDNSRLQLIKRDDSPGDSLSLYYIKSTEFDPQCFKFSLNNYDDILELDLENLIQNGDLGDSKTDEKVALVCTHGTYDSCCGKYGMPVFEQLKEESDFTVWRTTHLGGHRFSSNVVMFPYGIYYGRVNESNIGEIISAHRKDEIFLDCFRGRSCFSQTSQVSEFFLREKLNKLGINDIRWEYEKDRDAYTAVEFRIENEDLGYSVNTVVINSAISVKTSCMDEEIQKVHQFYFYSLIPYKPDPPKED